MMTLSSCTIEIQNGLLQNQKMLVEQLVSVGHRFAIITDDTLLPLYGRHVCQTLTEAGMEAFVFSFPAGELYKTRATKESLENQLFEKGLGRDTVVVALGGGVVTDVGGYLAATYCRGVPLVMIPTSLLGMVDASIGGKTGVNVPYGKNMVGCIYQPQKVLIDPSTLQSLPIRELRNGVVEMIKHALIADSSYFAFLEENSHDILKMTPEVTERAIFESCRIKKKIVEQDERGNGKRHLLNFGHTVAHALEQLTHHRISHGEAVAIGLLVEGHLALQLGHLTLSVFDRMRKILVDYSLPLQLPLQLSLDTILNAMILDKKSLKGTPRFVIIDAIGSARTYDSAYCTHVDEHLIKNALQWMNDDLCCH